VPGPKSSDRLVYKIACPAAWEAACAAGCLAPAGVDARDGFIHLSAGYQVAGTLAHHFAGVDDLVLAAFEASAFGDALRWEASRDGALFPHLYGELRLADAVGVWRLERGADGAFALPALS
jgi:uncharacterized protein (DUF952 family)